MLPACLEEKVIEYVDTSLGDTRLDKCSHQINQSFYVKTLSRKLRKFIACRDTRQELNTQTQTGHVWCQKGVIRRSNQGRCLQSFCTEIHRRQDAVLSTSLFATMYFLST